MAHQTRIGLREAFGQLQDTYDGYNDNELED